MEEWSKRELFKVPGYYLPRYFKQPGSHGIVIIGPFHGLLKKKPVRLFQSRQRLGTNKTKTTQYKCHTAIQGLDLYFWL